MKLWWNLMVAVAILSLVGVVQAQQGAKKTDKKQQDKAIAGQVVSVDVAGKKLVMKGDGADAKETTVTVDDKTKITLDGKVVKLENLKAGQRIKVTPGTGAAKKVAATTEKKKDEKKKEVAKKDKAAK